MLGTITPLPEMLWGKIKVRIAGVYNVMYNVYLSVVFSITLHSKPDKSNPSGLQQYSIVTGHGRCVVGSLSRRSNWNRNNSALVIMINMLVRPWEGWCRCAVMKVCKYPPSDYYGYHEPRTKDSHPTLSILVFMVAWQWHGIAELLHSNISVWSSDSGRVSLTAIMSVWCLVEHLLQFAPSRSVVMPASPSPMIKPARTKICWSDRFESALPSTQLGKLSQISPS